MKNKATENTEGRNDTRAETEDRRQKTEDRRQKTEDRRQKTEDRRQKTEDRRQKTEDRLTAEIAETAEEPRGIEIRLRRGCLADEGATHRGGLDEGFWYRPKICGENIIG